jgi:hypothetical protein
MFGCFAERISTPDQWLWIWLALWYCFMYISNIGPSLRYRIIKSLLFMYSFFCTQYYVSFWRSCKHVTVHRHKFLIKKPTRRTNFSNLFLKWNCTCFGQFLYPLSGVFTVHTAMVYVIQVCCQLAVSKHLLLFFVHDGILAFISSIGLPSSLKQTFLLISKSMLWR